jgi:retinol dehydrogenase-12
MNNSNSKKVALVTGATSGIGRAAAITLAEQGYKLYLLARNNEKAKATAAWIEDRVESADISWLIGDMGVLSDVRKVAADFLATGEPLNLLFNNAGVTYDDRRVTVDGFEAMFAINHLAPFLLSNLLLDKLKNSGNARIVGTSSGAHEFVKALNIEDLQAEGDFSFMKVYGNSKLSNILFTRELAKRLEGSDVTANCFHPGFVATNLGGDKWFGRLFMAIAKPFVRSPDKGAETGLFLAMDSSIEGKTGEYYVNCKIGKTKAHAKDMEMAARLWKVSEQLTGLG